MSTNIPDNGMMNVEAFFIAVEEGVANVDDWSMFIDEWAEGKGWNESVRDQGEWAALAHTEISEAYEEHRKGHAPNHIYEGENGKPEGMAIEYADLLIRVFHWFAVHNIRPSEALALKMHYNLTRPYRHGGKVA